MKKIKERNSREIYNSRVINSSPEKIFSAISESKHLQNWWGPKGFSNTFNEFNFAKDGVWNFIMHRITSYNVCYTKLLRIESI